MFFESFLLNLAVLAILIFALIFDYVTKFFSYWYVRHVPYKTPIPFFGSDYHRVLGLRSTTDEVSKLYTKYPNDNYVGSIKSRLPDLVVRDPDIVRKVLSTDFENFHSRGTGLDKSQDVCLRNNLFYAEGEKWTLLREGLDSILKNIESKLEVSLHDCLTGTNGDTNVQQLLCSILDSVFSNLLLGKNKDVSISALRKQLQKLSLIERFKSYTKEIFPSVFTLFGLNTPPSQSTSEVIDILENSKLLEHITKTGFKELLNIKAKKSQLKSKSLSDTDIAYSTLCLFLTEGYIPCLNILTALLYELAKTPHIQETIRNRHSISDDDYLNMTIKEALRLHPPYSVISRQCVKTYHFPDNDMVFDKRFTVTVPVEAIQNDVKYYDEPNVFNPDRFLSGECSRSANAFLPFGAGPRKCIGEKLALQIVRKVTDAVIKEYNISTSENTPPQMHIIDHNFQRVIKNDIWLKFTPIKY